MYRINTLLIFLASLFFFSCKNSNTNIYTYFGGKIINPKTDHVILYSQEKVIDTLYLDDKNKFFGKFENFDEGLYYFKHGNGNVKSNNHIYIEQYDSLLVRLNTWDIEESIVFAGRGAERNNILVDCILEAKEERKLFYDFNSFEPNEFKVIVDSLKTIKNITYKDYLENHPNETKGFSEVLKIALTYPLYSNIEKYPFMYSKIKKSDDFLMLDENFYNHRQDVEYNNKSLMYYPQYSYYIFNYLYNKTYSLGHSPLSKEYSSKFTIDLLNIINDEIESEITRNAFLKQTVIGHFYNKSTCNINKEPFEVYFKLSSNEDDILQVKNLINDTRAVDIKKNLTDFYVYDYTNVKHSINKVINDRNVVLFFWNPKNVSETYIKSRMEYLEDKYSNIDFIQIKFSGDLKKSIKNLDIQKQFYINSDCKANSFLTSKMPRSILINKNGKILNGYASISSSNLNPYLENLNTY